MLTPCWPLKTVLLTQPYKLSGMENLPGSPMLKRINLAEALTWPLFITSMKPEVKISGVVVFVPTGFVIFDCKESWHKHGMLMQYNNRPSSIRYL